MPKTNSGRGWHGDSRRHARAGRLGGLTTSARQSQTFFSEIGRIGGRKSSGNFKNNSERARKLGRRGGLN